MNLCPHRHGGVTPPFGSGSDEPAGVWCTRLPDCISTPSGGVLWGVEDLMTIDMTLMPPQMASGYHKLPGKIDGCVVGLFAWKYLDFVWKLLDDG